jgi:hypothetical protein
MDDQIRPRSNPIGRDVLPQEGTVQFENGEIIFRDRSGTETGRLFNSKTGPMLDGVLSVVQKNDAAEFRIGAYYDDGIQGGGKVSFNRIRSDGMQEELGYVSISHVDNPTGDDRGQLKILIRTNLHADHMEPVLVATTAYSEEKFGSRVAWVGIRNFVQGLWKLAVPGVPPEGQLPVPPPVVQPPPVVLPPPPAGQVYRANVGGIFVDFPQGDWATVRKYGPVEDTDPAAYAANPTFARWREFVDKMIRRR